MSAWNYIGVVAWLIVLAWLIFMILNIRKRHLKMIIKDHKRFTLENLLLDLGSVIIFIALAVSMTYATFLRQPDLRDKNEVRIVYHYHPLVLQTNGVQGYFVKVHNGNGKKPIQYYTYWTNGARYQVSSNHAGVATGTNPLSISGAGMPWQKQKIKKIDEQMQHAFVAQLSARYRPNFMNGLGLRVGRHAENYFLIRVPADTFVQSN